MVTPLSPKLRETNGTPDYVVRPMTLDDLDTVNKIDRDAFENYRRQHHQLNRSLRLRTPENMHAAIERPHPGVVVEWPRGRVVGYCFTHVWGSVGWLGTLGVAPSFQGAGLGRVVIAAGLDVLRGAGCKTVALETMPESGKNLALYLQSGLESRQLTLLMQGSPARSSSMSFEKWDDYAGGDADILRQIGERLIPGLDPTPAAQWLSQEDAGETLVWWEKGKPSAYAVIRRAARRMVGPQSYLTVEALGCVPEAAFHWPRYVSEMQNYARDLRRVGLVLPVNARQDGLLRNLLDSGLRIAYTRVRMVDGPPLGEPDTLIMLTLAM